MQGTGLREIARALSRPGLSGSNRERWFRVHLPIPACRWSRSRL